MTNADYVDDLALLTNTPTQAEYPQHILEQAADDIDLYVKATKAEFMCFQVELVDQFTYLGSNISSTESDVNIRLGKLWTTIYRLSIIWK